MSMNESATGGHPRIRLTHDDLVPDRPVPIHRIRTFDGWYSLPDPGDYALEEMQQELLVEEFVLRELIDADLASESSVVSLLNTFGVLGRPFTDCPGHQLLTTPSAVDGRPDGQALHWTHAAGYLRSARAATRHWLQHLGDRPVEIAWSDEGFAVADPTTSWLLFAQVVNLGLAPYRPAIEVTWDRPPGKLAALPVGEQSPPDLFSAACRQIHNLVIQGALLHTCQNENCRKDFLRKRGPIRTGTRHTTGVAYCSTQCMNAQAQRDYRRRQVAEKVGKRRPTSKKESD